MTRVGDEENASQMKRKGMTCATGFAGCGAGRNGGREEGRMWIIRGSEILSVASGPHTAHNAKAAFINDSSSPTTVPT